MGLEQARQPALMPHRCSFEGCPSHAICGLQNKHDPRLYINVCATHYTTVTGRKPPSWAAEGGSACHQRMESPCP